MLEKIAIASAAFIALSSPAFASDIAAEANYNWSGFYAGVHGGFGFGDVSYDDYPAPLSFEPIPDSEGDNFLAGAQIGVNKQVGNWVVGVEADASYLDLKSDDSPSSILFFIPTLFNGALTTELDWLVTARGRVGYAFGNVLMFATGGLAFSEVTVTAAGEIFLVGPFEESTSKLTVGLTAGAGIEYALTERLSLRGEYQYVDLGDVSYDVFDSLGGAVSDASVELHLAKIGLNYRF